MAQGGVVCNGMGQVYSPGISAETAGSKLVFLGIVTIPPEGRMQQTIMVMHGKGEK